MYAIIGYIWGWRVVLTCTEISLMKNFSTKLHSREKRCCYCFEEFYMLIFR